MRKLDIEEMVLVAGAEGNLPPADWRSQSKCNNGLGNGDQGAPGGSFPNNNAENSVPIGGEGGFGIHPSGFPVKPDACGGD